MDNGMWYTHNGKLFSLSKERSSGSHGSMDEPWRCSAYWNKPVTEGQVQYYFPCSRHLEEPGSDRQMGEGPLPVDGGEGRVSTDWGVSALHCERRSRDKGQPWLQKIWMCLVSSSCTLKMVTILNCVSWIFYQNLTKNLNKRAKIITPPPWLFYSIL